MQDIDETKKKEHAWSKSLGFVMTGLWVICFQDAIFQTICIIISSNKSIPVAWVHVHIFV